MFECRKYAFAVILAVVAAAPKIVLSADEAGLKGNINGLLGVKNMADGDKWNPNDHQWLYGAQMDFRKSAWPISVAVDFLGSYRRHDEGGAKLTGTTQELAFGVRKVWDNFGVIAPFIGAGPEIARGQTSASVSFNGGHLITEDSDTTLGYWAGGGVLFYVSPTLSLGGGVRFSRARIKLFEENIEAGGTEYMFLAGLHF